MDNQKDVPIHRTHPHMWRYGSPHLESAANNELQFFYVVLLPSADHDLLLIHLPDRVRVDLCFQEEWTRKAHDPMAQRIRQSSPKGVIKSKFGLRSRWNPSYAYFIAAGHIQIVRPTSSKHTKDGFGIWHVVALKGLPYHEFHLLDDIFLHWDEEINGSKQLFSHTAK